MTITVLYYSPGQKATIFLETVNPGGERADGYAPIVSRIVYPDLTLAPDFPQTMVKLDTGLYFFQFTLPTGGNSIGSYLVDVTYNIPDTSLILQKLYQVVVTAPFGNYSISTQ